MKFCAKVVLILHICKKNVQYFMPYGKNKQLLYQINHIRS